MVEIAAVLGAHVECAEAVGHVRMPPCEPAMRTS
jgi:hypothetical protein